MHPDFTAAQSHNLSSSTFHNLPVELILRICEYLGPVARLILLRVCSRLRRSLLLSGLLAAPRRALRAPEHFFTFHSRLRRDAQLRRSAAYAAACARAAPRSRLARLGCSGCRRAHAARLFSARQLARPARERLCRGLEAQVDLCADFTTAGEHLLRALREAPVPVEIYAAAGFPRRWGLFNRVRRGALYVDASSDPAILRGLSHAVLRAGRGVTLNRAIPLPPPPPGPPPTPPYTDAGGRMLLPWWMPDARAPAELRAALRALDERVCPHLRTSSPELFPSRCRGGGGWSGPVNPPSRLRKRADSRWPDQAAHEQHPCEWARLWADAPADDGGGGGEGPAAGGAWRCCPAGDACGTRYALLHASGGVVLAVSAELGADPTHPAWLARCAPGSDGGGGDAGGDRPTVAAVGVESRLETCDCYDCNRAN
jgi:hypothetical protein